MIELLVVIIIISILAGIAVPVYLHQRQKAWDTNVKSDLYNAAIAQSTYNSQFHLYTGNVGDLNGLGFNSSANVILSIRSGGAEYCMEGIHKGNPGKVWFVRSGKGQPNPEVGTCD